MDLEIAVLIGVAALGTSALTAMLGFGGGVVLLALLLLFVEPVVAIPLHAAIQVISNGTRTMIRRHDVDWSVVAPFSALLLPAGALAIPVATRAPQAALQVAIALTVLAATWLPQRLGRALPRPSTGALVAVGGATGALNVLVGATGPLQAPVFKAATNSRLAFVGTFAATQTTGHLVKIALFGLAGFAPTQYLVAALLGAIGVIAGTFIGSRVLDRMPEARFDVLYLTAITSISLYLVADGLC